LDELLVESKIGLRACPPAEVLAHAILLQPSPGRTVGPGVAGAPYRDLRPLVLDDLGLGAAIEWLLQNTVQRAGVEFSVHLDDDLAGIGEPYASALFRILQESLTNVVRHARARRVELRLERAGNEALLRVADDGIGVAGAARARPGSFGLRGISERVLMLGGSVMVTGEPGHGTTVEARIPLDGARRSAVT
jgi:two-component system sensor histidine kinase UhpB